MNKSEIRIIVYKPGHMYNIRPYFISIAYLTDVIANKIATKVLKK